MKKLALALVCFASVAFFASCTPEVTNPEPTLTIINGDNYVYDGQTIDLNTDYQIGFRAASNAQTTKELASFNLSTKLFDLEGTETYAEDTTYTISGSEYEYQETLNFTVRELIGKATITASVTDVDGKIKTAVINLNINQPAVALEESDIKWVKTGHTVDDLSAYGLVWKTTNYKTPFTHILPAEGSTLYLVENGDEDFANIKTDLDLRNYFDNLVETARPIEDYGKIDCNASADYHDLLICKDAKDNLHAINITRADITTPAGLGTRITVAGKAK